MIPCKHDRKNPKSDCLFCKWWQQKQEKEREHSYHYATAMQEKLESVVKKEHVQKKDSVAIPHILHRVWVGDKAIPDRFEEYWSTWKQHHSTWDFKTWTESDIASFGKDCVRLCSECRNPAEISDVLRFFIVAKFGGVYIDTDFECYQSIDSLLKGWEFVSCWENQTMVASAFVAAKPKHPILVSFVEQLKRMKVDKTINQVKTIGPRAFTNQIGDVYAPGICILPSEFFYGIKYQDRFTAVEVPTGVYAVHWWSHTWEDWWCTLTVRIVGDIDEQMEAYLQMLKKEQLGQGDVITQDLTGEITTTHYLTIHASDRFTSDGITRIRKTLRHADDYGENDFGFLDNKGRSIWVQATFYRNKPPIWIGGLPVLDRKF